MSDTNSPNMMQTFKVNSRHNSDDVVERSYVPEEEAKATQIEFVFDPVHSDYSHVLRNFVPHGITVFVIGLAV